VLCTITVFITGISAATNLFAISYVNGSKVGLTLSRSITYSLFLIRSPESLRWPIAIRFRPSSSVVRRSSSVNFWTFLASSLEPLNQFQPDLPYSTYGWRGTKIVNFMVPVSLGPWGRGKNYPKLTNFQKSSSLQPHMWRKNWMHGDVEQEGLY
jgi:hypothetical protein